MQKKINTVSGIVGVYFDKKASRFVAHVYEERKSKHLGVFETAKQAEKAIKAYKKDKTMTKRKRKLSKNNASGATQVSFHKVAKCWHARSYVKGKLIHIGGFTSKSKAIAAKKEFDLTGLKPPRKLNKNNSSGVVGLYFSKKDDQWVCRVKRVFLGYFQKKEDAIEQIRVYKESGIIRKRGRQGKTFVLVSGVKKHKTSGNWVANFKGCFLGYFTTEAAALNAVKNKRNEKQQQN